MDNKCRFLVEALDRKGGEGPTSQLVVRVPTEVYDWMEKANKRMTKSDVAKAMLQRGIAAYCRDGFFYEDEAQAAK